MLKILEDELSQWPISAQEGHRLVDVAINGILRDWGEIYKLSVNFALIVSDVVCVTGGRTSAVRVYLGTSGEMVYETTMGFQENEDGIEVWFGNVRRHAQDVRTEKDVFDCYIEGMCESVKALTPIALQGYHIQT